MRIAARELCATRAGKRILRDVTLGCDAGEVLGVLGPSGAGKSTFFQLLVGEAPPDGGSVTLDGEEVTSLPLWARARKGMGYVPQGPSVLWDLTVEENLRTYHRVARVGGDEGAAIRALADRVSLAEKRGQRAGDLSGGERRRLELARALTGAPRVLVCDEPFAGVDPAQARRLGDLLRGLADEGVAVLLADHHVEEALRVCTRAVLFLDGAVSAEGTPDEFREHPLVKGRYLGTLEARPGS